MDLLEMQPEHLAGYMGISSLVMVFYGEIPAAWGKREFFFTFCTLRSPYSSKVVTFA